MSAVKVRITKNDTGEVREYVDPDGSETVPFMWSEGNYTCDCNREIFFKRARNEDVDLDAQNCSYGRYSVEILDPESNEVIYADRETKRMVNGN